MNDHTQVDDLVRQWQESRRDGQPVTPEQLCRGCPDLLSAVKECISGLESRAATQPRTTAGHLERTGLFTAAEQGTPATEAPPLGAAGRYAPVRLHAKGGLGE